MQIWLFEQIDYRIEGKIRVRTPPSQRVVQMVANYVLGIRRVYEFGY